MTIDKDRLIDALHEKFRSKLDGFDFDGADKPFQSALLGIERMAAFSLTHSVSTTLGDYHEIVAEAIALDEFDVVDTQRKLNNTVSVLAQGKIEEILNGLTMSAREPDHQREIESIREVCRVGDTAEVRLTNVDIWLERDEIVYMIDLKTAKPNKTSWESFKRTLLSWAAVHLYEHPNAEIRSIIGIPYNPYAPGPYRHWTEKGILDVLSESKQLLIGEELWSFLSGDEDAMSVILECYRVIGQRNAGRIEEIFDDLSLGKSIY